MAPTDYYMHTELYAAHVAIVILGANRLGHEAHRFRYADAKTIAADSVDLHEAALQAGERNAVEDSDGLRTPCPLCGERPVPSPYQRKGFKWPEGLRRHLMGFASTEKCLVTNSLHWLMRAAVQAEGKSLGDFDYQGKLGRMSW